jgi:hypothetical protein
MLNRLFYIVAFWSSIVVTFMSADNLINKKDYAGTILCFCAAVFLYSSSVRFRHSWLNEDNIDEY